MSFLSSMSAAQNRLPRKRIFHFVSSIFASFLCLVLFTGFTPGDECRSGLAAFEKEDYETAVKHFTEGAVEGDQTARMMLGMCYCEGYGVKKDEAKAVSLLQEAAKTDDEIALMTLGMVLRKLDEKDGLEYLKKSADKGCALAQFQVAGWYFEQEEESKAMEYFKKAAAQPLTDEKVREMTCHINSVARDGLNGKCPFDLARLLLSEKVLTRLGLRQVSPDEVILKPALLKK